MVSAVGSLLYEQIVDITREYLGPAADRFIARQIVNHLHKSPDELQPSDMRQLIDWLKLSMAFLTNDEQLIDRYVEELRAVSKPVIRRQQVRGGGRANKTERSAGGGKSKI